MGPSGIGAHLSPYPYHAAFYLPHHSTYCHRPVACHYPTNYYNDSTRALFFSTPHSTPPHHRHRPTVVPTTLLHHPAPALLGSGACRGVNIPTALRHTGFRAGHTYLLPTARHLYCSRAHTHFTLPAHTCLCRYRNLLPFLPVLTYPALLWTTPVNLPDIFPYHPTARTFGSGRVHYLAVDIATKRAERQRGLGRLPVCRRFAATRTRARIRFALLCAWMG